MYVCVCVCVFCTCIAFALIMLYPNVMYNAGACIILSAGHNVTICAKKRRSFFE